MIIDDNSPLRFSSFTGAIIDYFDSIEDLVEEYQRTFDKRVHEEFGEGVDGKPVFTIYVGDKVFGWARYVDKSVDI